MDRPEVINASVMGKIPQYLYTLRGVKLDNPADTSKGYTRTIFRAEVIGPDIVEDVTDNKQKYSVAGRLFTLYIPTDPISKQYTQAYDMFRRLGYVNADGSVNLDQFHADIQAGTLFFRAQLSSRQQFVTDGAGNQIIDPNTNQAIPKGWQTAFVSPDDIIDKVNPAGAGPAKPGGPF